MPSRADLRRLGELGARGLALAAILVALVRAGGGDDAAGTRREASAAGLRALLEAPRGHLDTLVVRADTALDATTAAWLAARRDAGAPVRWRNDGIAPLALAIEPSRDPIGGVQALVVAPGALGVRLDDSAGFVDSVTMRAKAASFALPAPVGALAIRAGRHAARAVAPASAPPKQVVVLGRAGWEGKFLLALVEERGWPATARFVVRPDQAVRQGAPLAFDTARVAVVVVLDGSAAAEAARIAAFVRAGGGLVLGPEAARDPAFASLRAGAPAARRPPEALTVGSEAPRRALALEPVSLATTAVALERRGLDVAVAARRIGAGRVVQVGYDETWRWRMTGPEGAPEAHRAWWSAVIAAASPEALIPAGTPRQADAPLARMVATLGPPVAGDGRPAGEPPRGGTLPWWLGAAALALLVVEWASRRLRGAR